jgi:hypothetical protein
MNEELKKYDSIIEDIADALTDHGFANVQSDHLDHVLSKIQASVKKTVEPKELIYLAVPYSYKDADPAVVAQVQETRFKIVSKVAAKLMNEGNYIFSPISHSHPLSVAGGLPGDWKFWEGYDRCILSFCKKVIVLRLPGWETSTGVQAEIKIARELGIPVEFIDHTEVL